MKWRVMTRTRGEAVEVWGSGLSQEMAESMAAVLRAWMPRSIFSAWAEPDWENAEVLPMPTPSSDTPAGAGKVPA